MKSDAVHAGAKQTNAPGHKISGQSSEFSALLGTLTLCFFTCKCSRQKNCPFLDSFFFYLEHQRSINLFLTATWALWSRGLLVRTCWNDWSKMAIITVYHAVRRPISSSAGDNGDTLWVSTLWCSSVSCSDKCWKKSPLSIIYSVAGPSICFSDRFISRSSIFNSACHASSQTVCVLFLPCIPGFWGMLQYTEKRREGHNIDSVHCRERKKEHFHCCHLRVQVYYSKPEHRTYLTALEISDFNWPLQLPHSLKQGISHHFIKMRIMSGICAAFLVWVFIDQRVIN